MGQRPIAPSRVGRGSIVLVPFPFTDLSATKRRPALVVSPDRFGGDDFVLCAISSRVPEMLGPWDVSLMSSDVLDAALPRSSVILVGKLFTMHRRLVVGQFGRVTSAKQHEVLERLTQLFAPAGQ